MREEPEYLPYGIIHTEADGARVAVRHAGTAIDLAAMAADGAFRAVGGSAAAWFAAPRLNGFMEAGPDVWRGVRGELLDAVEGGRADRYRIALDRVEQRLPARVGDYTDFYASYHHAYRVGARFRDPDKAVLPHWFKLPVGYHGRASSVVVSGTDIVRPNGQRPSFGPTTELDFEVELGIFIGKGNPLTKPVAAKHAESHIFGFVLLNDWSARDFQRWEYVPLGPFTSKHFATSVSPWVVPLEALKARKVEIPEQDPDLFPYLREPSPWALDIPYEVRRNGALIRTGNFRNLHWSPSQMIAHHTVTGCNLNPGDLFGSGTVSGPEPGSEGCLLETDGPYLEDGETVVISAPGFGEVSGRVFPAVSVPG